MPKLVKDFPALNGANGKKDRVLTFDCLAAFADYAQALPVSGKDHARGGNWDNGQSYNEAAKRCRTGDLSLVKQSDEFLSRFEGIAGFERRQFVTINDVAGGAPNVGAFLAGNPANMRRRARAMSEQAPLVILADLVSSGGIEASHLQKRGAAILALVRALSAIRPVSLYAVGAGKPYGAHGFTSVGIAIRLETAPIDLARAAHVFCSPALARNVIYRAMGYETGQGDDCGLQWAFNSVDYYRKNGHAYWQRALGETDCLFLAPPFLDDPAIKKPDQFVKDMIEKFGQVAAD